METTPPGNPLRRVLTFRQGLSLSLVAGLMASEAVHIRWLGWAALIPLFVAALDASPREAAIYGWVSAIPAITPVLWDFIVAPGARLYGLLAIIGYAFFWAGITALVCRIWKRRPGLLFGVLTITAAIFFGMMLYSQRQIRKWDEENPPQGRFVTVNGIRLQYTRQGKGKPVVFLHGADGIMQLFTKSIFPLASKKYDAIAFDRPGHGYSERPDINGGSPVVQAELIHKALNRLDVKKPILVGHSWSGSLVLVYALKYPKDVSAVVSLAGYSFPQEEPYRLLYYIPEVPVLGDIVSRCIVVPLGKIFIDTESGRAFEPAPTPPGYRSTVMPFYLNPQQFKNNADDIRTVIFAAEKYYSHYKNIEVPVVIVQGLNDELVSPRQAFRMHKALPQSKLILIPHAGHQLMYTRPKAVMNAIALAEKAAAKSR